jgi:hypothetical protein
MENALSIAGDLRSEYGPDALDKAQAMLFLAMRKKESRRTILMWTSIVQIIREVA